MDRAARILIIDDEMGMREGCRRALTRQGFEVTTAEHGVEGLRKLREGNFDLVLLDAMMPGVSGLEILDRVSQEGIPTSCVMITGYATVDLAAQAMKQGAHDFLSKPFTSDELLTVVNRTLEERRQILARRRRAQEEEELQQLERTHREQAKLDAIESRFMLVVVHELRNPAGVIKNYLQFLRGGYADPGDWDDYIARLDDRASQLLAMLDDLLELAHLKSRQIDAERPAPLDVAAVLDRVVASFRPQVAASGLDLRVDVQARPWVSMLSTHLESLWSHLIDNALRYTPHGHVIVSVELIDGTFVTRVSDTGIGVSTEELRRIFEEFYRSDTARAQVELGTGLGLPIVSQIVRLYHGTVEVDSIPGEGSTFVIRLPAVSPG
ncbi:MAG: response regulator [Anaerolineae bacterium]|nr:response regulator [Anaerolineae bacterium]